MTAPDSRGQHHGASVKETTPCSTATMPNKTKKEKVSPRPRDGHIRLFNGVTRRSDTAAAVMFYRAAASSHAKAASTGG